MVRRCTNPKSDTRGYYFHKGIQVYPLWTKRWEHGSYEASIGTWAPGFWQWLNYIEIEVGERPEGYTLDRINKDGHYCPHNLRWASDSTQQLNKGDFIQNTKLTTPYGLKWVKPTKNKQRWEGSFSRKGNRYHCGTFDTKEEAYEAVISNRMMMGLPLP
jgi:hypothetical protein